MLYLRETYSLDVVQTYEAPTWLFVTSEMPVYTYMYLYWRLASFCVHATCVRCHHASTIAILISCSPKADQGRSGRGWISVFIPPKKQISPSNFLWGKNNVRTAIRQFYTHPPRKKTVIPQNKFLATPLKLILVLDYSNLQD